jgi:hypothetical protein
VGTGLGPAESKVLVVNHKSAQTRPRAEVMTQSLCRDLRGGIHGRIDAKNLVDDRTAHEDPTPSRLGHIPAGLGVARLPTVHAEATLDWTWSPTTGTGTRRVPVFSRFIKDARERILASGSA